MGGGAAGWSFDSSLVSPSSSFCFHEETSHVGTSCSFHEQQNLRPGSASLLCVPPALSLWAPPNSRSSIMQVRVEPAGAAVSCPSLCVVRLLNPFSDAGFCVVCKSWRVQSRCPAGETGGSGSWCRIPSSARPTCPHPHQQLSGLVLQVYPAAAGRHISGVLGLGPCPLSCSMLSPRRRGAGSGLRPPSLSSPSVVQGVSTRQLLSTAPWRLHPLGLSWSNTGFCSSTLRLSQTPLPSYSSSHYPGPLLELLTVQPSRHEMSRAADWSFCLDLMDGEEGKRLSVTDEMKCMY